MELYLISLATVAALNVMLAVGLNLISGFCGQISLGHAAFYGLGAYAAALAAVAGGPFVGNLVIGIPFFLFAALGIARVATEKRTMRA